MKRKQISIQCKSNLYLHLQALCQLLTTNHNEVRNGHEAHKLFNDFLRKEQNDIRDKFLNAGKP